MRSPVPASLFLTAVVVLLGVLATTTFAHVDRHPDIRQHPLPPDGRSAGP